MTRTGLEIIAQKPPIVATHVGGFAASQTSQDTVVRYEREDSTYVRPHEIQQYQHKLLDLMLSPKTTLGCLVAPFGYGKTSTTIGIWQAAREANILAIPPFSCNSIAEMGLAIATGVQAALEPANPDVAQQVQAAYNDYLVSSAERLAHQDADQYDIDFEVALQSIQDKIERGHLQLEASGINLLRFLEQLVAMVENAGYAGLLIIVDEFQQFLGTINKAIITNFRTLVWGLKTRAALPLGFLLTMDPDTERNLSDRAGDILHRIKQDGLYLNIASLYDREFPRLLWERYATVFDFHTESQHIVDRATLEAIGQICERSDLSNGPRTVINAFQEIARAHLHRHGTSQHPYTPLDLMDAFLSGDIKFDGDRNKIASLITELTSYDYIRRVPSRVNTLKLIAAFPRGCPREVAEQYGLADAFDHLTDELRGEVIIQLAEGMALIDLQKVGKPQNKLNIILKKYWMQITEAEIISDAIVTLFAKHVLDPLFPAYGNMLSGWRRKQSKFTLTTGGGYWQTYEGTFSPEYPMRRVCVQVCRSLKQAVDAARLNSDLLLDLSLVFVLHHDKQTQSSEYYPQDRTLVLYIPTMQPFDVPLAREIRWIEDYLSPVVMTPGVLLSLIEYINIQLPTIEGITEGEVQRIQDTQAKLQSFLLTMLFDEKLFSGLDKPPLRRGPQALHEALFTIFQQLYPDYQTLITTSQWESHLKSYETALNAVTLLQRRGIESLGASKAELATLFGYRNHAGFQSQARQLTHLLTVNDWSGDTGEIHFTQHPGESHLLSVVTRHEKGLSEQELWAGGHRSGYTVEELGYLIKFLELRGYLQYDHATAIYLPTNPVSYGELTDLEDAVTRELMLFEDIFTCTACRRTCRETAPWLTEIRIGVDHAVTLLHEDTGDYSEVQVRLAQQQRHLYEGRGQLSQKMRDIIRATHQELHNVTTALEQPLPECRTDLILDTHLNGVGRTITDNIKPDLRQLSATANKVSQFIKAFPSLSEMSLPRLEELAEDYHHLLAQAQTHLDAAHKELAGIALYKQWLELVNKMRRIRDYLEKIGTVTDVTTLRQSLESIIEGVQEELSTAGLPALDAIYATYAPQIDGLWTEVDSAVRVAELTAQKAAQQPIPDQTSRATVDGMVNLSDGLHHNRPTPALRAGARVSIPQLVEYVGLSPTDSIEALIEKLSNLGIQIIVIESHESS